MRYDPPAFAQLVIDHPGPSALSPHPPSAAWVGILVAAPSVAYYRAGQPLHVPIAVTMQLEVPPRPVTERVSATLVDEATQRLQREPIEPVQDNVAHTSDEDAQPVRPAARPPGVQLVTAYLHPDLAAHFALPAHPGRYRVVVHFRGHSSAPQVISVAPDPRP